MTWKAWLTCSTVVMVFVALVSLNNALLLFNGAMASFVWPFR